MSSNQNGGQTSAHRFRADIHIISHQCSSLISVTPTFHARFRAAISSSEAPIKVSPATPLPPYNNATFARSYELGAPLYFSRKVGYAPSGGEGMLARHWRTALSPVGVSCVVNEPIPDLFHLEYQITGMAAYQCRSAMNRKPADDAWRMSLAVNSKRLRLF
jgi:hypothetical protein